MQNRRAFLAATGASLAASPLLHAANKPAGKKKKMAVVTTLWTYGTHAWHMAERFLHGYPLRGEWHHPNIEVVSAYVEQQPSKDLSKGRAKKYGFTIYPTVADALRCGGKKLAVDCVLLIGEHGNYPTNEFGQKLYPRYRLFNEIAKVFEADERTTPVFNDKHLSWKFEWAKDMVETSRRLKFPFLAGSSLPVTWRMPSVEMPYGADLREAMCIAYGPKDIYDFHALETLQCMTERRRGGETGIASVEALKGDAVWKAMAAGSFDKGGWNPKLIEACLSRSQTLGQPKTFSHRYPTVAEMKAKVKTPRAFRFVYRDGLKATMMIMNNLVTDFTFAGQINGMAKPLSTLCYLPPNPNVVYSGALMHNAEKMFMTGKAPYPVERTMLTSGMVESGLHSLKQGKKLATPHLSVKYRASKQSTFWRS